MEIPNEVKAPVQKGSSAGYMVYKLDGKMLGRASIVYGEDVQRATFKDVFMDILKKYCI